MDRPEQDHRSETGQHAAVGRQNHRRARLRRQWEQAGTQTEVPGMRRVDVSVRAADAEAASSLATVSGFVGRTALAAPPSATSWDVGPGTGGVPGAPITLPGAPPLTGPRR
ncbi:MAG: type II secretion system protein GspI [Proteobacteria bacterium]|nr:type II secretion system protein GspI [Pseudomonadota bacterium]